MTRARDIGSQSGWTSDKLEIAAGSIGALESTIEGDVRIDNLARLD